MPVISAPVSISALKCGSRADAMRFKSDCTLQPSSTTSYDTMSGDVMVWIIMPSEPFS